MAASILKGALPKGAAGEKASQDLIVGSDAEYEQRAIELATGLGKVLCGEMESCRLLELRKLLYEGRWTSALFDTRRWVRDLEEAYDIAWDRYVEGKGGDIWL
jgi:predicted O-linked N-acetylglucosamine transferase (SPINDLY family)